MPDNERSEMRAYMSMIENILGNAEVRYLYSFFVISSIHRK